MGFNFQNDSKVNLKVLVKLDSLNSYINSGIYNVYEKLIFIIFFYLYHMSLIKNAFIAFYAELECTVISV